MRRRTFLQGIALGTLTVPVAARLHAGWAAPTQAGSWTVLDLGDLGQGTQVEAQGLNNQGQVVGEAAFGANTHAFLWDAGTMYDLGTLGGPSSVAYAVNDGGQVGGAADTADGATHAFLWQAGTMSDLGDLGYRRGVGRAINNAGIVVGSVGRDSQPFVWQNGAMTALDTAAGAAAAINTDGLIVGYVYRSGYPQACVWQNGQRTALVDGSSGAPLISEALAVNTAGQVTGALQATATDSGIGFLWDGVTLTPLPNVAEGGRSINAGGQIIGYDQLWTNGQVVQLVTLVVQASGGAGWTNVLAAALNDAGQIAGTGRRQDGARRAVLLSPA